MIRILFIGLLFVGLSSCQAKQNPSPEKGVAKQDTVPESVQAQFPFPTIPSTLTEPEARKSYLLTHYWERFDFADTTLVDTRDITEQGFVNFIALLADGTTPDELMRESMENWCRRLKLT